MWKILYEWRIITTSFFIKISKFSVKNFLRSFHFLSGFWICCLSFSLICRYFQMGSQFAVCQPKCKSVGSSYLWYTTGGQESTSQTQQSINSPAITTVATINKPSIPTSSYQTYLVVWVQYCVRHFDNLCKTLHRIGNNPCSSPLSPYFHVLEIWVGKGCIVCGKSKFSDQNVQNWNQNKNGCPQ